METRAAAAIEAGGTEDTDLDQTDSNEQQNATASSNTGAAGGAITRTESTRSSASAGEKAGSAGLDKR